MDFVFVGGKGQSPKSRKVDFNHAALRQSEHCLISLISGLHQKDFGYDTIYKAARDIAEYRAKYIKPTGSQLFIDSGGYSIIVGNVPPGNTVKFINCYHKFLEIEEDNFDFIFSLDIPFSRKYNFFNEPENRYKYNLKSLADSKSILQKNPNLIKKWHFVWQFRTREAYAIFKRCYDELGLNNLVKNRALGGMVGLRGETHINFSPFPAMAYRCFLDYLTAGDFGHEFRLHFLGIYILHDRIFIAILEKLFYRYLLSLEIEAGVAFTYDTVNFMRTAQLRSRKLEVFHFDNNTLTRFEDQLDNIPDQIIRGIYVMPAEYNGYQAELDNLRNNRPLIFDNQFLPLNIYSNKSLDSFFEYIIQHYKIIDIFLNSSDIDQFKRQIEAVIADLKNKYPDFFTRSIIKKIIINFENTYAMHYWFKKGWASDNEAYSTLDIKINNFIDMINPKKKAPNTI